MQPATAQEPTPPPPAKRPRAPKAPRARKQLRVDTSHLRAARVSRWERLGPALVLVLLLLSAAVHLGAWAGVHALGLLEFKPPKKVERPLEVAVIQAPEPPPPPPPEPEPAPVPPPPPPPKPKLVKPKPPPEAKLPPPPKDAPPPPPDMPTDLPPPPNTEAAEPSKAPPVVIPGISFSSTSTTGSFSVNTGNTLYGQQQGPAVDPKEVKPYKAERYAPAYKLTEMPRVKYQPDFDEMTRAYPEEARRNEIEGEVKARITIDDDGTVVKVVILKSPGYGLDGAAKKLLPRFRFHPAKENGVPVATEIDYTFIFELPY